MKYNKVSAKLLIMQEIILLFIAAMSVIILSLALDINSFYWWIGILIVAVLSLIIGLVYLPLLRSNAGWAVDGSKLYIKKGIIFTRYSYIPIDQIVNVVIIKNPLTFFLKISTLIIKATAAKGIIRGIDLKTADKIMAELSSCNEK